MSMFRCDPIRLSYSPFEITIRRNPLKHGYLLLLLFMRSTLQSSRRIHVRREEFVAPKIGEQSIRLSLNAD